MPELEEATRSIGREPSDEELIDLVRRAFQDISREGAFKTFEIPRDFVVEREVVSYENGLLSSLRKPVRPNLKKRFGARLEALYEEIENRQKRHLEGLKSQIGKAPTAQLIGQILEACLGLSGIEVASDQTFPALGGDSLSAVSFSLLLEDVFGVEVPVSDILGPAGNVRSWAKYVDRAGQGADDANQRLLAAVLHDDPTIIRASALTLPVLLGEAFLAGAAAKPPSPETKTVLLTGANGFLGRFLCLDWLDWASRTNGKVICLLRAADAQAARKRLELVFSTDPELLHRFRSLADGRLEVVAGDLASPRLGVDELLYARLASEVDHIVHPASLVNHRLVFQHLFGPNVVGTVELVRLALSVRQKSIDYVSSIGVVMNCPDPEQAMEQMDIRQLKPEFALNGQYANGYSASKWAGEVLLAEAHQRFGLPIHIFRPDMILAHSRYRGQINAPDMFSRLLLSIALTGLAPNSFYDEGRREAGAEAHYDGLPVDFISRFIAQASAQGGSGFDAYNIINTNYGDGISLDRIADWAGAAGHPLHHIASHRGWVEQMEQSLRNLPEARRQASMLQVMDAFRRPLPPQGAKIPTARFRGMLEKMRGGPSVPQLGEGFIRKCLDDLGVLGSLKAREGEQSAPS